MPRRRDHSRRRSSSHRRSVSREERRVVDVQVRLPKPLFFWIGPGTTGDHKPLAILAVYAAKAALPHMQVKLLFTSKQAMSLRFLPQLALTLLGPNWSKKLELTEVDESVQGALVQIEQPSSFSISASTAPRPSSHLETWFGFGDTPGTQWKSAFFGKRSDLVMGPVYLPTLVNDERVFYSDEAVLQKLRHFRDRNRSRKIVAMAGSLRVPFYVQEIADWVTKNAGVEREFAFLLINYRVTHKDSDYSNVFIARPQWREKYAFDMDKREEKYVAENTAKLTEWIHNHSDDVLMLHSNEYVEFEDVFPFIDLIVTNCGAGSVTAALMSGCPQYCRLVGEQMDIGADKPRNESVVRRRLRVGPTIGATFPEESDPIDPVPLDQLLTAFSCNWSIYTHNARTAKGVLETEHQVMEQNASVLFGRLQTDREFQEDVSADETLIAEEFANHVVSDMKFRKLLRHRLSTCGDDRDDE